MPSTVSRIPACTTSCTNQLSNLDLPRTDPIHGRAPSKRGRPCETTHRMTPGHDARVSVPCVEGAGRTQLGWMHKWMRTRD